MSKLQAVRIPSESVESAKKYGKVFSRSVPKQIEHWISIGKIAEENPDLPYSVIKDILIGMEEVKNNETTSYSFG